MKTIFKFSFFTGIFIFCFAILFSACESLFGEKPRDLTHHYYAEFDTGLNRTIAGVALEDNDAGFTEGPETGTEDMMVNNCDGGYSSSISWPYSCEFDTLVKALSFVFTDRRNNEFSNLIRISDIDSIEMPDLPATLDHDNALEIEWVGTPLEAGERIDVYMINETLDEYWGHIETEGATSITIPAIEMNYMLYDEVRIYLSREKTIPLPNHETPGDAKIKYYSNRELADVN